MTPTNDHAEKVAATIRGARATKGLTQEQLGKAIGRSRLWVTQLERARWYTSGEPFSINPHDQHRENPLPASTTIPPLNSPPSERKPDASPRFSPVAKIVATGLP